MQITIRVITPQGQRQLQAAPGETLYNCLTRGGIALDAPCGGHCFCGKCKVQVEPSGTPGEQEAALLTAQEIAQGYRLACGVRVEQPLVVRLDQRQGEAVILAEDTAEETQPCHQLAWSYVQVPEGTIEEPLGDRERLCQALGVEAVPLSVLNSLPEACRADRGSVAALLESGRVVDIRPGCQPQPIFGLAVDIGTTTVVAYLVDLVTGRQLQAASMMNPQKSYGDDVISRIDYASQSAEALGSLRDRIVAGINELIGRVCQLEGVSANQIYRAVLVGNTVMIHLLAGVSPLYIARSPFIPAFTGALCMSPQEAGLRISPTARIYTLPNVASYVGADIVASVMASGMDRGDELTLMVDIGTNGEMVLGNRGRMLACSTAAGPALEGAHISCGMGGVTGAISSVKRQGDSICCGVIGQERARGLCGSGLVDAVAMLLEAGALDETGRLDPDEGPEAWACRFSCEGRNTLFRLTEGEPAVTLSQKDIREVQLAKGAIAAGIEVLARAYGVQVGDIQRVCLAGGFGNYIDRANACRIGLLPAILMDRIEGIGNGAGAGARMALLSEKEQARAGRLAGQIQYIELSAVKEFQDLFMDKMLFD